MDILRKKGEHETEVIKNNFSMIGKIVICNIELENVGLSSICNEITEFEILVFVSFGQNRECQKVIVMQLENALFQLGRISNKGFFFFFLNFFCLFIR